jgi:hypothetical protein
LVGTLLFLILAWSNNERGEKESTVSSIATVVAAGSVKIDQFVELFTPAEMDDAVKQTPLYRPPGQ